MSTVWSFDTEKLAAVVKSEKGLRGVSYQDMQRETGVNFTQISNFVSTGTGVGLNGLIPLAMWSNADLRLLVKRNRNAVRHVASPQERELRNLARYLEAAGLPKVDNESPVEAAIRLLALAREQGADFDVETDE